MWSYDDYKIWLKDRLTEIKDDLDFKDYIIEVFNEQDYATKRSTKPKTITVVTKSLASSLMFSVKTQPIQMIVISEENGLSVANSILTKFAETYNYSVLVSDNTYVKHIYSTPVVLSNFNVIGIGQRAVLYINTTLFILEGVMDIRDMHVRFPNVSPINLTVLSATVGYTMTGDTQPFGGYHAQTEKNFSTLVMTLNVPCTKNYFTQKCIEIMAGQSAEHGNETFIFTFYVGDIEFEDVDMKLVGATISTAVNNVPSLQLSFSV